MGANGNWAKKAGVANNGETMCTHFWLSLLHFWMFELDQGWMMMSMMFQAKMVREKEKEGDELRANIAESNQESEANIEMKRRQTQNNIKVREICLRWWWWRWRWWWWWSQSFHSARWMGEYSEADWNEREDPAFAGRSQGFTKTAIWPKFWGEAYFLWKAFHIFRISVTSTGLMKGRQDTGRGKLFTCYIKMKYVSKLSEIWNWKLRSNSYWRSELINFL